MTALIQRLFTSPYHGGRPEVSERSIPLRVLAVTADVSFYAAVLSAAGSVQWDTEWARTLNRAIEICRLNLAPVVIYDGCLPGVGWEQAFDCLGAIANRPRLLLASGSIDEGLWRSVLEHRGYDVVERWASPEELKRVLRFARLSLLTTANA